MNKSLLIIAAILVISFTTLFKTQSDQDSFLFDVQAEFQQWKQDYGVQYPNDLEDYYRLGVFIQNKLYIQNNQGDTYTLGVNQFMAMTHEEWRSIYLTRYSSNSNLSENVDETMDASNGVDWRTKGAVQVIKNQGNCGSCWAFSAVGSLESLSFIKGEGLGNFSEQQLVDCSRSYGNQGCNGGLETYAFKYVKDNGITNEEAYPYVAKDQKCKINTGQFKITSYKELPNNCQQVQQSLQQQPVSVGVDASNWQHYTKGVFSNCQKSINHGVELIGYDDTNNWIIKNSWGSSFGEKGYITLKTGNTCGLCQEAAYPIK